MYESFWQLQSKPFENTADPQHYFPAETHQGALLKLRYVIENRRGAALLTGGSGLGKSLLTQTLLRQLDQSFTPRVQVVFPQMPPNQLLAYLAESLSGDCAAGPHRPSSRACDLSNARWPPTPVGANMPWW